MQGSRAHQQSWWLIRGPLVYIHAKYFLFFERTVKHTRSADEQSGRGIDILKPRTNTHDLRKDFFFNLENNQLTKIVVVKEWRFLY